MTGRFREATGLGSAGLMGAGCVVWAAVPAAHQGFAGFALFLAIAAVAVAAFEFVRRRFALEWGRIQGEIEAAMTFKEPS